MDEVEKTINAWDLIDWIMCAYPDWCIGDVKGIVDHIKEMPSGPTEFKIVLHDKDHIWINNRQYISLRRFQEAVNDARQSKQWIPYHRDDEIPYNRYLVQCKDGKMYIGSFTAWGWMFAHYVPEVVAYMPLPEPYTEERHDL